MAKEITPMFDLVEEKTLSDGCRFQRWDGVGYELIWRQYSPVGINIQVTPDKETSRFLPYIYVNTDDDGCPICATIQTTSYGSLRIEEYVELQRAMAIAQAAVESIEAQFINRKEEVSSDEQ